MAFWMRRLAVVSLRVTDETDRDETNGAAAGQLFRTEERLGRPLCCRRIFRRAIGIPPLVVRDGEYRSNFSSESPRSSLWQAKCVGHQARKSTKSIRFLDRYLIRQVLQRLATTYSTHFLSTLESISKSNGQILNWMSEKSRMSIQRHLRFFTLKDMTTMSLKFPT